MRYIHFSAGGGLYVYYVGIAQAIYETVDHDVLRQCKIGGTSAGMCGAMALFLSLYHEDMTPILFFEKYVKGELVRRGRSSPTGFYLQGSKIAYDTGCLVYERLYCSLPSEVKARLYCIVSDLPTFRSCRMESFETMDEFATFVSTTMSIPFLVNSRGWNFIHGRRIIDGYMSSNRHYVSDDPTDQILYFNVETKKMNDPRYKCVNIMLWLEYNLKFLLPPINVNHDTLYERGVRHTQAYQSDWKQFFHH